MYQNRRNPLGVEYIDSTKRDVCHNKRINSNKAFAGIAEIGKPTIGWFIGFKFPITCGTSRNLTSCAFTKGNADDASIKLMKAFKGKLFATKGYISKKLSDSYLA